MLSKELIKQLSSNKILVDINLVPPYGLEGVKPEHDDVEIYPGIHGIGALGIGRLKYKVEREIFTMATNAKGKKIFDYNISFEIASKLLFGEEIKISVW